MSLGTIHLRRRQFFYNFRPLPPLRRQFFTTIRRQIWQIFNPSPPKKCRRLKWMVPYTHLLFENKNEGFLGCVQLWAVS